MLNIRKILVPVASGEAIADTTRQVARQAACLARRFEAEVILLHAVPPLSYPAGWLQGHHEIMARDLHSHVIQQARQELEQALLPELEGLPVTRLLRKGDPAREIVETADELNADLIALSTDGEGAFYRFLLGSITAKVLHETSRAVWTSSGAYMNEAAASQPEPSFSIGHVLCSVDLSGHSKHTLSVAAGLASGMNAMLTLIYITPGVDLWGPGGKHVDPEFQKQVVDSAIEEVSKLQQEAGTKANVVIESGNVPEVLNRVAKETRADVLVLGHAPGRSHLGDNGEGYGIIRASHIPVLSVAGLS